MMTGGRRWAIALLASGFAAARLAAQQSQVQMTLSDAVRHALEVQPAVVQAIGAQRNAGAAQRAATGAFLPSLTLGATSNGASASRFNSATGQILNVPASTSYTGSLALTLDLFDGVRRFANKTAAAATQSAANAGLVNQRYQVTSATAQLFFAALANEDLVRVAQAQVDRAKEELQISLNKFQAGSATRSDTLTSTVDFGNAQLALLQAQANLATAQANLGRQVGLDQPVRAVPDTVFPALPDSSGLRAEALSSSPQVQQAEATARAARAMVTVAHGEYWPTLSLAYSNGYSGLDAPWSDTGSYVNNWTLRFSVSWTLFNGFSREQDQVAAAVQRDVAEAEASDARRQINALFTEQLAALVTAHAQIDIAAADVIAGQEALRVEQERYRLGAATLLDVLTAEANLTQAEVTQVQARYNYLVARSQLEAVVGRTL